MEQPNNLEMLKFNFTNPLNSTVQSQEATQYLSTSHLQKPA